MQTHHNRDEVSISSLTFFPDHSGMCYQIWMVKKGKFRSFELHTAENWHYGMMYMHVYAVCAYVACCSALKIVRKRE